MRALVLGCMLVAGLAAVAGCPEIPAAPECGEACRRARICGLIPSPLGVDTYDDTTAESACTMRCRLTTGQSGREAVTGCFGDGITEADRETLWCSGTKECAKAAACLRAIPSNFDLLPSVSARVFAVVNDASVIAPSGDDSCQKNDCADCLKGGECSSTCGALFLDSDARKWCTAVNGDQIVPLVEQGGTIRRGDVRTCPEMLTQPAVFSGLTPERARVGFELRTGATQSAADGGSPTAVTPVCRVIWGAETLILGDTSVGVPLPLPETIAANDGGVAQLGSACPIPATAPTECDASSDSVCDAGCDAADGGCE